MSVSETPVKAEHLNEISDSVAAMVACVLQEQLAPILDTIREHSKLLNWHSALLNHSTVMNHYNVGKLDDLRDLQTNVNYKLQFIIDPEDRKHPTYRGLQPTTTTLQSTVIDANAEPSSQGDDSLPSRRSPVVSSSSKRRTSVSSRDCTNSPSGTSVTSAPDPPTRQPTPIFDPPESDSLLPTPPQVTADGRGAPITRRGLRRERPHDETPDPMWNSSREIDLFNPVPAPMPPPPRVSPPADINGAAASRHSETGEASTVAGKKRKRDNDDDASSCNGEAPPVDTSDPGSAECDEPERKRKKDTTISTERLPIPENFLRLARLNIFGEPSFEERRCEVEQMRYMRNLFRNGAT